MIKALFFLVVLSAPASAQGVRADDVMMSPAELNALLGGSTVEFFDGSKARYASDGGYTYTFTDEGPEFVGTYTAAAESQICVTFTNGASRCDTYVRSGERLVMVIEDGTRFPVRERTAN